jgi:beta-lactamase class C
MMTADQAGGVSGGVQSMRVTWEPAHWGFGWEVKGAKRRHWTGDLTSPATFCHFGRPGRCSGRTRRTTWRWPSSATG